jgi:hypothetical protein
MTTRETLHKMVDLLPESEWEAARRVLEEGLAKHDPVLRAFLNAPEDDEPESEEERAAVEEAYEDLKAGRVVSDEELKRELGL